MAGLIGRFHAAAGDVPLQLSTLDATAINIEREAYDLGFVDHPDHVAAAQFTVAGFVRYHTVASAAPRSLRQYRGYSIDVEPFNLDAGLQSQIKRRIFYRYGIMLSPTPQVSGDADDPHFIDLYEGFTNHKYTMQFGDLDGDGRDDVCGRGKDGMLCALSDGVSFGYDHSWSFNAGNDVPADTSGYVGNDIATNTRDFGDNDPAGAWAASPAKYRSMRLVDINRDGLADVCGRAVDGIWCALSTGTAFEAKRLVISTLFTDQQGWDAESYGSTLSFGHLDGNDRIDLCARGIAGIWCSEGP